MHASVASIGDMTPGYIAGRNNRIPRVATNAFGVDNGRDPVGGI